MFNVFDILVSELAPCEDLELRRRATALGAADDVWAYVAGVRFGRVVSARQAYSNLAVWAGGADRGEWLVFLVSETANEALRQDGPWSVFLANLVRVLTAHSTWLVTCESDCDQQSLEQLVLSPEALVERLHAFRAEPSEISIRVFSGPQQS